MLSMIRQLFSLLTPRQVKIFCILQLLVILMAVTELIGIASIAPFMAIIGDISLLEKGGLLTDLYRFSGVHNPMDFLFYTGVTVLVILAISSFFSMFTIWKLSLYAANVGTEIADRLYAHYMQKNWLFHSSSSSSYLIKQVASETIRVTDQILRPLMQLNAKLVLALFISISIFIYDPLVAFAGLLIFALAYFLIFRLASKPLRNNGNTMSRVFTERFKLMNEGFGGIKDVLLLDRRDDFVQRFKQSGKAFAYASGTNNAISQVPRYFMELIAFGAMIALILLLIKLHKGELGAVLPVLAVYALASFKLLPALQQIYFSAATIKGNIAAFDAIKDDLAESLKMQTHTDKEMNQQFLSLKKQINLTNISFTYPNKPNPAISNLNLNIPVNSVVGLVGKSGCGKSTTIDILLGLLTPQQGKLYIDDICITSGNKRAWQNMLGYVPQSIFLSEGTIAENVAFGLPSQDIDLNQVKKALQLANLTEMVSQLANGINTKVGERGVQLSGGQRQRIGIARALYHEACVLVFDEATSALDGMTEKAVMEAIHDFNGKKTIIMIAHRLKTIEKCDIIYFMEEGTITDQGTYQQLLEKNSKFKEMAKYA